MKTQALALFSSTAIVAATAGIVHAEDPMGDEAPVAPVIDASITSVVFDPGTGTRAIAGFNGGSYLGIDRIANGKATGQVWIDDVIMGGASVPVSEFRNLRITGLRGSHLTFEAQPKIKGARDTAECSIRLKLQRGKVNIESTACGWKAPAVTTAPPPVVAPPPPVVAPPPPPPVKPVADLQALKQACDQHLSFPKNQRRCVDMGVQLFERSRWSPSTMATIAACTDGFDFEDDAIWCLEAAPRATREPAAMVRYCTTQAAFRDDQRSCVAKYTTKP